MILPNFLIIGAQKCGTTWLADQIGRHPDVFVAPREIHYFDKEQRLKRGPVWYSRHFLNGAGRKRVGEKTPDYLWANGDGAEGHLPQVHYHLHALLPNARLITVLRNPVDRFTSALLHLMRTGRLSPDLTMDELALNPNETMRAHGIVEKGFYWRQLTAYLELFPRERMLTLIFEEDIVARPEKGLRSVCEFLELDYKRLPAPDKTKRNESRHSRLRLAVNHAAPKLRPVTRVLDMFAHPHRPRLGDRARAELTRQYARENQRLFALLGREMPESWQ
jgi:hypothetical protein